MRSPAACDAALIIDSPVIRGTAPLSSRPPSSPPDIPFAFLVEQSLAGMYVIQDECFQYANATWASMIGYTPDELVGEHLSRFVPPAFLAEVLDRCHRRLAGNPPTMRYITHGLHRDGRTVLIEVHGTRMLYRERPAIVGVGIDVTERVRGEEALRRSNAQLQELASHTSRLLEDQRLKLSHEVHDVLGGMLTSMKMDVTRVLRRADTPELVDITQGLLALTQETIAAVRRISEELRPGVLDHLDLSVAIDQALQAFAARHGVACTLDAPEPALRLSPKAATAVYRIVQEALTNIARHAEATQVTLRLRCDDEHLHLEVADDGKGFDADQPKPRSLGLLTMSERARELGGSFAVDTRPGAGTRLTLTVPLL
jgi:two-component system sensor histidine kinase UhpB